jgi:glutaminase
VVYLSDSESVYYGDHQKRVTLQSFGKALLVELFLTQIGYDRLREIVALVSHTAAYNSLELDTKTGLPYDPFQNSGALLVIKELLKHFGTKEKLKQALMDASEDRWDVALDDAKDALACGARNKLIVSSLLERGLIDDVQLAEQILDAYYEICFVTTTLPMVARKFLDGYCHLNPTDQNHFTTLLSQFGMYQASASWKLDGGFPAKSSVSGLIGMILSPRAVILCHAPGLNDFGNSKRGSDFCLKFSRALKGVP